ncbi:MAG: glucuronate isomerase [Cardiobacteriaceae bacterium]|nr:glucuronate isomerase [Cardiobacteriaceae bacterium]
MTFLTDDFLLHSDSARTLYHDYAKNQPIFDYHCHLPPADIAANRQFADLSAIWLEGDHYKWRGLRTLGIAERLITGDATPREKFQTYAEAVPRFIGNPLYHWTHLELKRPFGITTLVNGESAESIWNEANARLAEPEFRARGILKQMNVKMVGTTDDPCDNLEHHAAIAADKTFDIKIRPSFRPDKAIKLEHPDYPAYLTRLESASGISIHRFHDLTNALSKRLDHFAAHGCIASDHGLEILRYAPVPNESTLDNILSHRINGIQPNEKEIAQFQTALLIWLGMEYAKRHWVMQLHIGPIRNNNSRMYNRLGPDSGYDSIGDHPIADNLSALLDAMDEKDKLPKTILYTINPRDNALLATMCGNFQAEGIRGKVQYGSGWWFNDQKDGMIEQLTTHAQMGILSTFVGMLTDSRSFLSYTRHEYFRRILCNLIGKWVEKGEAPRDLPLLGAMVENICYHNAAHYFDSNASTS